MKIVSTHFQPEALKFLRGLARHNDREWFEARRPVYEVHIKTPMLALVEEVNASMIHFAPDHVRTPAKTMMRIYRDTRFSNDKRPYKTHAAAWFGRRGCVRTTGAGFYLHISGTELRFGAGVFVPLPEQLLAVRQWMATNHAKYEVTVRKLYKARTSEPALAPANLNPLARMPKGFAADHAAGELLRARRWGVLHTSTADMALGENFAAWLVRLLQRTAPIVALLDEALESSSVAATKNRWKPMF